MAKGFPIKMRPRLARPPHKHSQKTAAGRKLVRLEKLEHELEDVSEQIQSEITELERLEEVQTKKVEYAWIHGGVSHLLLQDFVGAAFGAIFFVVTQEVWDISARLVEWQVAAIMVLSFFMGYTLVYASRRRKSISAKTYHHAFMRCFEMYLVSLAVSALFVVILATAPSSFVSVFKQSALIAVPAIMSAATADLLFY